MPSGLQGVALLSAMLMGCSPPFEASTAEPSRRRDSGWASGVVEHPRITVEPSIVGLPLLDYVPVNDAYFDSGFGPRRLSSEGLRTDFHLGIDLDAPAGTPVRATAEGVVYSIDRDGSAGKTVVLAHTLDEPVWFHGEAVTVWYARYLHLQDILVAEGEVVEAGGRVGSVGDTGDVAQPHTHFEARLGTWCSLRYALENPSSDCVRDYDPAINPLHMLPLGYPEVFTARIVGREPLAIRITISEEDVDLNRIETPHHVLDYDLREGLDPTSEDALDALTLEWVEIDPIPDAEEPDHQSWIFTFPNNPSQVTFVDIRGEGLQITP